MINYDFGNAVSELQGRLKAYLEDNSIVIPVKWYGGSGKFTTPSNAPYMRDTITVLSDTQGLCGWKYTESYYTIDIYYPDSLGVSKMYNTAKQLRVLFENEKLTNAKCMNVETNPLPDEKPWIRLQLNINFYTEGM